jgi:hypothetical protein
MIRFVLSINDRDNKDFLKSVLIKEDADSIDF